MIRQYYAQRHRMVIIPGATHARPVGVIPVGTVFECGRHERWIVEGWHPREYTAAYRDRNGHWANTFMRGGHLATCRRLRDGKRVQASDAYIRSAVMVEEGAWQALTGGAE